MTKTPPADDMPEADGQPSSSQSSGTGDAAGFRGWTVDGALHPLMQHQTASVAAAAAVGFGMASHFAGFMLGAMQGFMEAAQKSAAAAAEAESSPAQADAAPAAPADASKEERCEPGSKAAAPEPDAVREAAEATSDVVTAAASTLGLRPAMRVRSAKADAPVVLPPRTVVRPAAGRRGKGEDDLKRIAGIGPKLEQVLKGLNVTRFAQIAAWDEADMQKFDAALGVNGRIARDRWVEQAKALVKA